MNSLPACRVCLAYDTRLCSIMDGQLDNIYEKLVEASLDTEDMLPTSVCYICFSLMKKILKFRDTSQKANQILQQMISSGLEPSVDILDMLVKDQTGISCTLGISDITWITTTSEEIEEVESEKSEIDVDGMNDQNEDYSDSMPVYRDSPSDCEDDLPLQNISEQCETDHPKIEEISNVRLEKSSGHEDYSDSMPVYIFMDSPSDSEDDLPLQNISEQCETDHPKIEEISNVRLEKSTGYEDAAPPEKRNLDENEAENELVNTQAPLRNTEKDEDPRERKEDKKKKPDVSKGSKKIKPRFKAILKETETTTTDLISGEHNNSRTSKYRRDIKKRSKLKKYQCSYCVKRYSSKRSLSYHLRFHTKQNLHKCFICEKVFSRSCHLTSHYRVHTKEKPFKCDICQKCFTANKSLIIHLRIHSGEKPYSCPYCDKRFIENGSLTSHLRVHTKEKPYKCDICEKCFSESSSLTVHKRIHSGEKPYSCSYCDKRFATSHNRNEHVRRHIKYNNR